MTLEEFRNSNPNIDIRQISRDIQSVFGNEYNVNFVGSIDLHVYIRDKYGEEALVEILNKYVQPEPSMSEVMNNIYELIKDDLSYCTQCNHLALSHKMTQMEDGHVVCEYCRVALYNFTISGRYVLNELCVSVFNRENYHIGVEETSRVYFAEDTLRYYDSKDYLYEIDGKYYYNDYRKGDPNIYSYHYHKSEFRYIGVDPNNSEEQIGFELEIVSEEDTPREDVAYMIADNTNLFVFERDSSIGSEGVECITHITSLKHLEDKREEMCDIFKKLKRMGVRSHDTDTCGLHIHVNRAALGSGSTERNETLKKLLYLVEMFRTEIEVFSRRRSNNYARFRTNSYDDVVTKKNVIEDTLHPEHHYYNVNTQPSNTIEFRMFRGTLRYDTILLSIVLCKNLIGVAKSYNEEDLMRLEFNTILTWNLKYDDQMLRYYNNRFKGGE